MNDLSRRQFLSKSSKNILGSMAAGWTMTAASSSRVHGANERLRVALVGCGGRGQYVARNVADAGAQISYLCDPFAQRIEKAWSLLSEVQKEKPKTTQHYGEVLQDPNTDAVIVATPDHWHALITLACCQAGKDVYVEKPSSHNIKESLLMIQAAKSHDRVIQVGTQNRSAPYVQQAREYVASGKLGSIPFVKVYNLKPGDAFRLAEPGDKPEDLNWDLWLGPASSMPFHRQILHHGWLHMWDLSAGEMAGEVAHQLDLALMVLGDPGMPLSVSCSGGRFHHAGDDSEMPDIQVVTYQFKDRVITLEHSMYPKYMAKTTDTIRRKDEFPYWTQNATRVELYGSETMMTVGRHGGGWQVTTSSGRVVDQMYGRPPDVPHVKDFLDAVKKRRKANADLETIYPSCAMIHMANIAYRTGNKKLWVNDSKDGFRDAEDANALLGREYRAPFLMSL